MTLVRLTRAVAACLGEATRRAAGDPPDDRYEVPLAMLLDLGEELEIESLEAEHLIEELHAT